MNKKEPCRHCKRKIEIKMRQCPYCGTLNPTVKIKEIIWGMVFVLIFMAIVTYFVNN